MVLMPYKDPDQQRMFQHLWYLKNKEGRTQAQRKDRQEKRAFVNKLKSVPCADCGETYPYYVMDFDHKDNITKLHNLSYMVKHCSMEKIKEEVKKCDVVCSNCHRERTYQKKDCFFGCFHLPSC